MRRHPLRRPVRRLPWNSDHRRWGMATEAPPPSEDRDPADRPQGADDAGASDSGAAGAGAAGASADGVGADGVGAAGAGPDGPGASERDADPASTESNEPPPRAVGVARAPNRLPPRSEEHTSELQS